MQEHEENEETPLQAQGIDENPEQFDGDEDEHEDLMALSPELHLNKSDEETQAHVRKVGNYQVNITQTRFCIEEHDPQLVEGPLEQDDVQADLSQRVDPKKQARFLSAGILMYKADLVDEGLRASIELLAQRGTASMPSRNAIVFKLIQLLRKLHPRLDAVDQSYCIALREQLTASLMAITTPTANLARLMARVDLTHPTLKPKARRGIMAALQRYHEELYRATRKELNRTIAQRMEQANAHADGNGNVEREQAVETFMGLGLEETAVERMSDELISFRKRLNENMVQVHMKAASRKESRGMERLAAMLATRGIDSASEHVKSVLATALYRAIIEIEVGVSVDMSTRIGNEDEKAGEDGNGGSIPSNTSKSDNELREKVAATLRESASLLPGLADKTRTTLVELALEHADAFLVCLLVNIHCSRSYPLHLSLQRHLLVCLLASLHILSCTLLSIFRNNLDNNDLYFQFLVFLYYILFMVPREKYALIHNDQRMMSVKSCARQNAN